MGLREIRWTGDTRASRDRSRVTTEVRPRNDLRPDDTGRSKGCWIPDHQSRFTRAASHSRAKLRSSARGRQSIEARTLGRPPVEQSTQPNDSLGHRTRDARPTVGWNNRWRRRERKRSEIKKDEWRRRKRREYRMKKKIEMCMFEGLSFFFFLG